MRAAIPRLAYLGQQGRKARERGVHMVQVRASVRRSLGTIAVVVSAAGVLTACSGAVVGGPGTSATPSVPAAAAPATKPSATVPGVTATTHSTTQPWVDADGLLHVPLAYGQPAEPLPAKDRQARADLVRLYLKALKGMDVDEAVAVVRADGWAAQIVNDGGWHTADARSGRVSFFQDTEGRVKYANPL